MKVSEIAKASERVVMGTQLEITVICMMENKWMVKLMSGDESKNLEWGRDVIDANSLRDSKRY